MSASDKRDDGREARRPFQSTGYARKGDKPAKPASQSEESPTPSSRQEGSEGENRPRQDFGNRDERPRRDFGNRDERPRRDFSNREERPRRDFDKRDDRPRRDFGNRDERPRRDFGNRDERPRRDFGSRDERPRRDFGNREERPRRDFGNRDERPRRDFGNRDERPRRDFGNRDERPRRDFGNRDERPRRDFGNRDERPRRDFGNRDERPRRDFGSRDERPRRDFGSRDERPRRDFGNRDERPRRDFGNRDERPRRDSDHGRPHQDFNNDLTQRQFGPRDERTASPRSFEDRRPLDERRPYADRGERRPEADTPRGERRASPRSFDREQPRDPDKARGRVVSGHEQRTRKPAPTSAPLQDLAEVRLNRYIASAGVCSRREADELIQEGEIYVNNEQVTELGYKVKRGDVVRYKGKALSLEKPVYVLLNKPKDFITTTHDPEERKTVLDLVRDAAPERLFPVGRLDRNTTGLLLLTNDGDLAERLSHPSYQVKKIYQVDLDRPFQAEDMERIREGITLDDGPVTVDALEILTPEHTSLGLELHLGRNRIVRRLFEHLGYEVVRLDRVVYAGLTKKDLPRGKWRYLTDKEVVRLKHFQR